MKTSIPPLKYLRRSDALHLPAAPWKTGGEAAIYRVGRHAAKVYHETPGPVTAERIRHLVNHQPRTLANGFVGRAWAWPTDAIVNTQGGELRGSVTPLIEAACPLGVLFDARAREQVFPGVTARHLPHIAANVMELFRQTHELGVIVGDVSPSNLLVNTEGGVSLVDLESAQVTTRHAILRCGVGTPDYLAPEIAVLDDFTGVDRDWRQDAFGVAALAYQLLTAGVHFCDGGAHVAPGEWPPIDRVGRITVGAWHGSSRANPTVRITPPRQAIDYAAFGPELGALFRRCFDDGFEAPSRRPTLSQWRTALQAYTRDLRPCRHNHRHAVHASLADCPWCEVAVSTKVDPFPIL
jgi:DNA-binding helix-hairpin-helix protein with protein kinase domain